ncbi:AraC family transcriptional regulator [Sediminicoccus sp. KRV36]|uniref:AraC family transcriptional regulator n=1 Tax=Sediminicoccus sp. KRV36 TaxID=3133721 RepID=UPI00200DC494|nr:AraC family transcriptional regulator [Sediminicoccus rosea]UPY38265.1 AraC family transcriptional regulator [Sediminicoccus rosea]
MQSDPPGASTRSTDAPEKPPASVGFSTAALPVAQQFDAWRDHCSSVVEITEALGPEPGYRAGFRMWSFGHFALSAVQAPPTRFRRTPRQIRRDSLDHWVIHIARKGHHTLQAGDADMRVPPGQPHIFSLDQVMEGQRSEVDWLCLFVARDAFPKLGAALDARREAPLQGPMAGLLGSYIEALAESLPGMASADLPHAAEATRAVVAACLAAGAPPCDPQLAGARLGRVRQIIRGQLASARLDPERLCRLAGMSRSQLYRLFEPYGGVARFIQSERLGAAHRALADAEDRRDVLRIAEAVGFYDPSAFSRAFRREFGYSPTTLRMNAATGWVTASPGTAQHAAAGDFAGALRRLSFGMPASGG